VVVFLPLYRTVRDFAPDLAPLGRPIAVDLGFRREEVRLFREVNAPKGPKVVFVDIPSAFSRSGLYGEGGRDYADNARRFALYSRAVLDAIPRLIAGPVLVHAHDWHASLALLYMRSYAELRERFAGTPTVLTVHNGGYQGHFSPAALNDCGIPPERFTFRHAEWYGKVNFLKAGLTHADMVVTVSPNHAAELRTADGGFGLHEVFQWLGNRFTGIVNGIDQAVWNPADDDQITAPYSDVDPTDKARGKVLRSRLFWLAVFGLIHGLAFWFGDILLLYAWTGLFVMLVRSWSARSLLIAGVQFLILGTIVNFAFSSADFVTVLGASAVVRRMKQTKAGFALGRWIGGSLMIGLGLKLATDKG
jgi:starch synthase